MSRYLYQQYINAPESIFADVYKLPGAVLRFSKGKFETWKYWDIRKVYAEQKQKQVRDYGQAKAELKELLKRLRRRE